MWMILLGGLRRRWVEHSLLALLIAVVIAGLGALRATSAAAEAEVHELAHRLGRNMLVLPAETSPADFHAQRYGGGMAQTVPDAIRASPAGAHVSAMQPRLYGNLEVKGREVIVVGEEVGWPALPDGSVPAVAGEAAARALELRPGSTLELAGARLTVVKVVSDPVDGLDTALFMPLAAAQRALDRPGELSAIRLGGCWCSVDVEVLGRQVEAAAPGTRAITVASLLGAQKGTVSVAREYGTALHVAAAALVAAIVAVLVLAGTRRRVRELGLLAAIGCRPETLSRLLIGEAALIGLLGGLAGWLLGSPAAAWLTGAAPSTPPGGDLPFAFAAAALSALAAALPAQHAAALDPAVALRETPP